MKLHYFGLLISCPFIIYIIYNIILPDLYNWTLSFGIALLLVIFIYSLITYLFEG